MDDLTRVPRLSVILVVLGGMVWLFSGVLYGIQVAAFPTSPSVVLAPGVDGSSYPAAAIRSLAWDDIYATVYVAAIGLLAIFVALNAFRRGERWAWYAVGVFALAGVATAIVDELAWGGWYTFLFLGLLPLLGLVVSVRSFFPGRSRLDMDARTQPGVWRP